MEISIPVSPGELLDKISILEIKRERIADPAKRANVARELALLQGVRAHTVPANDRLETLYGQLKAVNETLWEVEDRLRDCERRKDFSAGFVEDARAVYRSNDRRAALKREINSLLGSELVEEKSYASYE